MSPRHKERTDRFTDAELVELHRHFGTITHAFEILLPLFEGRVSWSTFRLAAGGHLARPSDLDLIRSAIRRWKATPK